MMLRQNLPYDCRSAKRFYVRRGLSRKIGLRRAATGHVFSYNVLCRKIYPTLPEPRTYVHYRFSIISARPARCRIAETTALQAGIGPELFINSLYLLKKHFYIWCAGLKVHALLTVYTDSVWLGEVGGVESCCRPYSAGV
jgi:hypothetical protein